MPLEIEKINLYIRIKWFSIILSSVTITVIGMLAGWALLLPPYIALSIELFTVLLLQLIISNKRWLSLPIIYFSLGIDLAIIIASLYFSGGPENTWWFLPIFVTSTAGFLLSLPAALAFALLAFLGMLTTFLLESYNILPHIPLYNTGTFYWRIPRYIFDYISGMFLLYFFSAVATWHFNKTTLGYSSELEKTKQELET